MKSPIVKRSIVIGGHKTSVSLEDAFWRGLKEIARAQRVTLSKMVADIDKSRSQSNLSSAIRLFVLDRLRNPLPPSRRADGTRPHRPSAPRPSSTSFIAPNPARLNRGAPRKRRAVPVAARRKSPARWKRRSSVSRSRSAPAAWSLSDGNGTIAMVNGEVERLFGYTRDELLGRPIEILLPERSRSKHVEQRGRFADRRLPPATSAARATSTAGARTAASFPSRSGSIRSASAASSW